MIVRVQRKIKISLKCFLIIFGVYFLVVSTHIFWLPWMAKILILDRKFKPTEIIAVSTGSYERFRFAVDLVKSKQANYLLLLGDQRIRTPIEGKSPLDMAEEEAKELGIPTDFLIAKHSTSTWVDAQRIFEIMKSMGFQSGAVITDTYNMRRLTLVFNHIFKDCNFQFQYIPVGGSWNKLHPDRWWRYPLEFEYVIKEWIKLPLNLSRIIFE